MFILPVTPNDNASQGLARTLLDYPSQIVQMRLSPNGRWVAYASDEANETAIYVASFPSFAEKHRVSPTSGFVPTWRADGKEIFYLRGDSTLMSADVHEGSSLDVGASRRWFRTQVFGPWYDVNADGTRFLIAAPKRSDVFEITVVLNWTAELQK